MRGPGIVLVAAIGAGKLPSTEAFCGFFCCLSWVPVFERNSNCDVVLQEDPDTIRGLFAESLRFRYDINGSPYAFFKEENLAPDFDVYQAMFENWQVQSGDYGKGNQFAIYSSEEDMIYDVDNSLAWEYCPEQDNSISQLGFPGSCAPTEAESHEPRAASLAVCQQPKAISFRVCSYTLSAAPTVSPTSPPVGVLAASSTPTVSPTKQPTEFPTKQPTKAPTSKPTESPTKQPTEFPTKQPTESPTKQPTKFPTKQPTKAPTSKPTESPTTQPTESPTKQPTKAPTSKPTESPTTQPTESPTKQPSKSPTTQPTESPTTRPTESPTKSPTSGPTARPKTLVPTQTPTETPTKHPAESPTGSPTSGPTGRPETLVPTQTPTASPTTEPSPGPTTASPSLAPTADTSSPTQSPTNEPSLKSTQSPTKEATLSPSRSPTIAPTTSPTTKPLSSETTSAPSASNDFKSPTMLPTSAPASQTTTEAPSTSKDTTPSPTMEEEEVEETLSPTTAPTRRETGLPSFPACTQASVAVESVQVRVPGGEASWCPGFEPLLVLGNIDDATKTEGTELDIFALLVVEEGSTPQLERCKASDMEDFKCTFSLDDTTETRGASETKVMINILGSSGTCSLFTQDGLSRQYLMKRASDEACLQASIDSACINSATGLSTWNVSFGGRLGSAVEDKVLEGNLAQCVFLDEDSNTIRVERAGMEVSGSQTRVSCANSLALTRPTAVVIETFAPSDTLGSPRDTVYRFNALVDPCQDIQGVSDVIVHKPGSGSSIEMYLLVGMALGGVTLCGCGGTFCLFAARRKRELEYLHEDQSDPWTPLPPATRVEVNMHTGQRREMMFDEGGFVNSQGEEKIWDASEKSSSRLSRHLSGMANSVRRFPSSPFSKRGGEPCSPRQVDTELFAMQPHQPDFSHQNAMHER